MITDGLGVNNDDESSDTMSSLGASVLTRTSSTAASQHNTSTNVTVSLLKLASSHTPTMLSSDVIKEPDIK